MTADAKAEPALPYWAGVTEPMTVLTNVLLALYAMVLAARLGYVAIAERAGAGLSMTAALMSTALAAVLGACAHAIDPRVSPKWRHRFWRLAVHATGLVGATSMASVAFFAARGTARIAILAFAALSLAAYTVVVAVRPQFGIAMAGYGGALAIVLVGAVYALVRWRAPGAWCMIAGVAVSLVAGLVQQRRVAPHRQFNHNDLYHVIQMVALYMFYRGGALLVDR